MDSLQKKSKELIKQLAGRNFLRTTSVTLMGIGLVLTASWMAGCSTPPEAGPVPSKQEIQSDADRFFNKMEKEEAKKEAKEAKP